MRWRHVRQQHRDCVCREWWGRDSGYELPGGSPFRAVCRLDDGCSHAAPLVTGIASLIKARYRWLTTSQLAQVLISSAVDLGPAGRDNRFGWGRVDARRALEHAILAFEIFGDGFETGDAARWSATVQ
jgi:hypothetical protein